MQFHKNCFQRQLETNNRTKCNAAKLALFKHLLHTLSRMQTSVVMLSTMVSEGGRNTSVQLTLQQDLTLNQNRYLYLNKCSSQITFWHSNYIWRCFQATSFPAFCTQLNLLCFFLKQGVFQAQQSLYFEIWFSSFST